MVTFTRTVLPNGLRIIFVPQKDSVATTILVLVEAGSKYETKDINGLSHFLEHMCFKGTTKRPKAMRIAGELDALGAEYNAFTSQEWTGYYAKVESHKAHEALDLVSDLYLNPVFDVHEIEKEKGVIIEELNMYVDQPMRHVQELFTELLYGDQPAGWNIGGRKEVIRTMTRDHFTAYRAKHYLAAATAIVVAGSFDEQKMQQEIEKHFAEMPTGKKGGKLPVIEEQIEPAVKVEERASDQTHLVLGVRAFPLTDPRRYALEVLSDALGGGMSSRLFQRVREELGAAYYVRAGADLLTDHGYLEVAAGVEHGKLSAVIEAVLVELRRAADVLMDDAELARVKSHLTGRLLLGLETSDALANYYGGQEVVREKLTPPDELARHINRVSASEVREAARAIMKREGLNLALVGPKPPEGLIHLLAL
jgi:predicted Zn-dependent peptidase